MRLVRKKVLMGGSVMRQEHGGGIPVKKGKPADEISKIASLPHYEWRNGPI